MYVYHPRIERLERRRLLAADPMDVTFDSDGIVTLDLDPQSDIFTRVESVETTLGPYTVAAGSIGDRFLVARFTPDGQLDPTFNNTGWTVLPNTMLNPPTGLAIDSDGRILVAGTDGLFSAPHQAVVARLTAAGQPDTTWDGDGWWYGSLNGGSNASIAGVLAHNGSVYLAGTETSKCVVLRFTSTGTLDASFGPSGTGKLIFVPTDFNRGLLARALELTSSGSSTRLLFGGQYTRMTSTGMLRTVAMAARITLDGALDGTFGTDGIATFGGSGSISVTHFTSDPMGRVLIGGRDGFEATAVVRLTEAGAPDPSFGGGDGMYVVPDTYTTVNGLAVSGNTIVFSTGSISTRFYALTSAGDPDTSFGTNGVFAPASPLGTYAEADVQADGKVVFAGSVLKSDNTRDTQVARILLAPTALITAGVFNDLNANGVQEAGEGGLSGWTLYLDANNNAVLDPGERSAVTDATGTVNFDQLPSGDYILRQVGLRDWRRTAPASGAFSVTLTNGASVSRSFGNTQRILLGGTVFHDLNRDGVKQSNEPGLAGWRVYVDVNNNGEFNAASEPSRLTDSAGKYQFNNLPAGTGTLRLVRPAGWTFSAPQPSGAYTGTVPPGGALPNLSFGNYQTALTSAAIFAHRIGSLREEPQVDEELLVLFR